MKRLCLVGLGLLGAVAAAKAETPGAHHSKPVRAHAVKVAASNSGGLAGVAFSDPYAPPVGAGKTAQSQFPAPPTDDPVEVKGGFSLTAGRDAAGEPMTGGLKFRF